MSTNWTTIADAADELGVHRNTIRRWIASGRLPAYRAGRSIRIKSADLDGCLVAIPSAMTGARR